MTTIAELKAHIADLAAVGYEPTQELQGLLKRLDDLALVTSTQAAAFAALKEAALTGNAPKGKTLAQLLLDATTAAQTDDYAVARIRAQIEGAVLARASELWRAQADDVIAATAAVLNAAAQTLARTLETIDPNTDAETAVHLDDAERQAWSDLPHQSQEVYRLQHLYLAALKMAGAPNIGFEEGYQAVVDFTGIDREQAWRIIDGPEVGYQNSRGGHWADLIAAGAVVAAPSTLAGAAANIDGAAPVPAMTHIMGGRTYRDFSSQQHQADDDRRSKVKIARFSPNF